MGILGRWILYALFGNDDWVDIKLEYLGGMIFLYTLLTVIATVAHMRVTVTDDVYPSNKCFLDYLFIYLFTLILL